MSDGYFPTPGIVPLSRVADFTRPMPTEYFFVMPSAARGAASVIDLGAALRDHDYLFVATPAAADALAHAVDRRMLSQDFAAAREQLEAALPTAKK